MPTRRMIDPAFWQSESVMEMNREERLFFIGLISNADDQGRLKANPKVLRAQICMGDHDVTVKMIDSWLAGIARLDCITLYEADGKRFLQIVNWWKYQFPQWAYPSKIPPPQNWHDRLRYRADSKIITENWQGENGIGFEECSDDDYPNLGNGSGNGLPSPLPKDKGKALDYTDSIVESSIEIGLVEEEEKRPPENLDDIFGPAQDHSAEIVPTADSHQQHVDQGLNGGTPSDPAEEVAKNLFRGVRDNPTLDLPRLKRDRKGWISAANRMLEEANGDWRGLCAAVNDWFENTPADDEWTRKNIVNPHNTELTGKITRHYGRMKKRLFVAQPAEPRTPVEKSQEEKDWDLAIDILKVQFKNIIYTRPLKRTNGSLQVAADSQAFDMCQHRQEAIEKRLSGWMSDHNVSNLKFVQS